MDGLIHRILDETDARGNPYLVALRERAFDRDDFVETQIQFFHAVVFFNRPMAIVAAKIPSGRQRVEILRNVWEEHGEGRPDGFHEHTFLDFLHRIAGIREGDVWARALWPEVRAFNTLLTGAAVMDHFVVGVATMGMIERLFADISAEIAAGIVGNGWLPAERLVHYNLHANLDVRHAGDFFDVLRARWELGGENAYQVEQGLRMGAYAFDALYRGLWRARGRRAMRGAPRRMPGLG